MNRFKEYWDSGYTGRGIVIGIVVTILVVGACLMVVLSGLGLTRVMSALFPTAITTGQGTAELTGTPDLTQTGTPAVSVTGTALTGTPSPRPSPTVPSHTPTPTRTPVIPTATPRRNPSPTATTAQGGYTIISLTSPVQIGQNATLTIHTVPNSSCNLTYITPQGVTSNAPGLGAATATARGVCSWTWKIIQNTKPGTGKLEITAGGVAGEKNIIIQ